MASAPYPLLFEPILLPKVWGGDRLARFGKKVAPGDTIGESWELADLAATSASGAGGGAQRSVVRNGPLGGKTLHDLIDAWGDALLPRGARTPAGAFPVLIKFLDAREDLSVQVHPSPDYAAKHPEAHLKTECWYVLDAEPGALIYKGVREGVSRSIFEAALKRGDKESVLDCLALVPAIAGECHNLPSGTLHALGAGVLVAEVQSPSDTTFRVYDWGRVGRELHIPQALECIDFAPALPPARFDRPGFYNGVLGTDFFLLSRCTIDEQGMTLASEPGSPWTVLGGDGEIARHGKSEFAVHAGDTGLTPAGCGREWTLRARPGGELSVLFVRLPGMA